MLNKIVALFLSANLFLSASAYALAPNREVNIEPEISAFDVEILLSRLPEDYKTDKPSNQGKIAIALLVGGYLYSMVRLNIKEDRAIRKEIEIKQWLQKKMPSKQWSAYGKANMDDIVKFVRAYKRKNQRSNKHAVEMLEFRGLKSFAKGGLFLIAALSIDYIVFSILESGEETVVSNDRIVMERFIRQAIEEDPAILALVVYSIPNRKLASQIIAEDLKLYTMLKEQVEFALSQENRAFTNIAFQVAGKIVEDTQTDDLKQQLRFPLPDWANGGVSFYEDGKIPPFK